MRYLSVAEIAKKWNVSERSVRNYCAQGRVNGAFLTGKTWNIPENAEKPERTNKRKEGPITLLDILKEQKVSKYSGGIYHKTQIDLTYNSNHMEGSRLTHDQTQYIFEINTIGVEKEVLNVDDVIETANHFCCIDMIIDCDFYHQWRKPDPDLSERQQRWRRSGCCTSLWKTVHAGDVMRTAGLYDGTDICEYTS